MPANRISPARSPGAPSTSGTTSGCDARNALIEDLILSQRLEKIGFVKGVGAASPDHPRHNLTGDPYVTDGMRAVLFFGQGPISLSEIQMFDWERPEDFAFRHLDAGADSGRD
jgi:hypothetical protein